MIHILLSGELTLIVPNRSFARLFVHILQFGAVIYLFSQIALLILGLAAGSINIGGLISVIVNTVLIYGLGIILDVALSAERALYELLAGLKRPRNQ